MFKWSAFPFIRFSVSLILGIICFTHFPAIWTNFQWTLLVGFGLFFILWLFWKRNLVFGPISLLFIAYLGGVLCLLNDQTTYPDHYVHFKAKGFIGVVSSSVSDRGNFYRYEVKLRHVRVNESIQNTSGTLHLYAKKGTNQFSYGDVLRITQGYTLVAPPSNPHEFDYKAYLRLQNIYAQAFVDSSQVKVIGYDPEWMLVKWAYHIRERAQDKLDDYISSDRERAILSALLLGVKDYLDNDLKDSYASAGAMHVLAVSGLHVGIIYFLLLFFLKPLKSRRLGQIMVAGICLSVIWMYALVTGFSPSVMRAATMFSVIIISNAFNRRSNIYNALGIAAFVLILFDPYIVYAVGFQLSFIAVIGIVTLHPWLYKWIEPETKLLDYVWSITCVSIAAQLATFPLSIFYFHQFPTYFMLANLMVIPASLILLSGGMLMVILGFMSNTIAMAFGWVLERIIWVLNEAITSLTYLPFPQFDWLYFDQIEVILMYLILGLLVHGVGVQNFRTLFASGLVVICFVGRGYWQEVEVINQKKIIFYDMSDQVAIDLVSGKEAQLLIKYPTYDSSDLTYRVDPNRIACGLPKAQQSIRMFASSPLIHCGEYSNLISWEGTTILVLNKTEGYHLKKPLISDIVYLNEDMLLDLSMVKTQILLLGSSISYYKADKLIDDARKRGVLVRYLADGFWELDLSKQLKEYGIGPI